MDLKDFSSRFQKARQKDEPDEKRAYSPTESFRLRRKILGVLIQDARLNAARTTEDCARLLNVQLQMVEAWEYGESSPTLPQLELLAYYLDVPVSHFWGQKTLESDKSKKANAQNEYIALRNRMIGALLRQAREEQQLSFEDVAERSYIAAETLQHYEMGNLPIPMYELSILSGIVNRNIDFFLETTSYVGELLRIREEWKHFSDLDPEVREFAANPLNIGFIKIAITFSQMSVEQLRLAAEGMLEISM
jgi:transcriptional regulator with XRE-family HTH domain